jgi:hypothetical protein
LKYEPGTIVAEGDFVIVHGRFSGFGAPTNWIAADIVRVEARKLAEHWDVIQDEATKEQSKSGAPMFGTSIPDLRWKKTKARRWFPMALRKRYREHQTERENLCLRLSKPAPSRSCRKNQCQPEIRVS